MKLTEYINKASKEFPGVATGVSKRNMQKFLRFVFNSLHEEINVTKAGRVVVPGLGVFIVKDANRESGDEKKVASKRIIFRPKARVLSKK
jgi:hypothetical protein